MTLTRYDPFRELKDISRSLNSFNDFFNGGLSAREFPQLNVSSFVPDVNTREGDFAYHIDVDLPGIEKDNIQIGIDNGVLTISGERKTKDETKEEDYYKVESSFGKFERKFSLPEDVDVENIHAESSNGVLEITVPKLANQEEQVRKIEIK